MTEQQYDTFSKFGKSFQEKLVKTILFDRNFANQMEEVLDTNYLELKYLQVFVDLLFILPMFQNLVLMGVANPAPGLL